MDLVSGRNVVKELLRSDTPIRKVYLAHGKGHGQINDLVNDLNKKNIEIERLEKHQLDDMVVGIHQGIVAEIDKYKTYNLKDLLNMGVRKLVVLDGIEDPHNVGAIIRSAETGGFDGVVIQNRRSSGITNTVHRSSAGATFHIKVAQVTNLTRAINEMKNHDIWVYGADGEGENLYTELDFSGGVCLVIGSESKGISRLVKENCDMVVKIPMLGRIESLNASTAAAVLIYEVVRQNG